MALSGELTVEEAMYLRDCGIPPRCKSDSYLRGVLCSVDW